MRQQSLTDGFETHRKKTRKKQFLAEIEALIPWEGLVSAFEPFYPKPKGTARRPIAGAVRLKIRD